MLKDIIEKLENNEGISGTMFENMKRYINLICRYFNVKIDDIKVVAENISNTLQAYYISIDYSDYNDIISEHDLYEVAQCGGIRCFDIIEVI